MVIAGLFSSWLWVLGAGCSSGPGPLNVIVISIDTMRADRLGRTGRDGTSLTPALDEFASQSVVFERAYSQGNETLFSHASMFAAQYPSEIAGLNYSDFRLPDETETLARALTNEGWRTEAIVGGGHLNPAFGVGAGFGRYATMGQFSGFQETLPQALKALDKFNDDEDPFFLFVHGYDCHTPYVKPGLLARIETPNYDGPMLDVAWQPLTYERILNGTFYPDFRPPHFTDALGNDFLDPTTFDSLERFASLPNVRAQELTSEDIAFILGAYDASVRSADFFVGVLLDQLAQTGLDENTAVIIMSDHGEDLLDHGHFNHRLGLEDEHVNVVLMARVPGVNPQRASAPVALLDVNATIRSLAGIPAPTRGQSLLDTASSQRAVYSESMLGDVAMRGNDFTLIVPRELAEGPLPEIAPDDAQFLDNAGAALPWSGPGLQSLWTRLVAEVPR